MRELDRAIRNENYARFVELGRAPRPDELGCLREEVEAAASGVRLAASPGRF
jgi:hypothetical protein